MELDHLVMGRNELAKWNKLNSKRHDIHIPDKNKKDPLDEPVFKFNDKNNGIEDIEDKFNNKVDHH